MSSGGGAEEHHVAAMTEQGQLYTWGSGRSGQLGHGDVQTLVLPRHVASLDGKQIRCLKLVSPLHFPTKPQNLGPELHALSPNMHSLHQPSTLNHTF